MISEGIFRPAVGHPFRCRNRSQTVGMAWTDGARWYEARLAQSRKPAHYRCPLCGRQLPAMSSHMLIFPEGNHDRRRHAHMDCVMEARRQGELLTRDEWRASLEPSDTSGARSERGGLLGALQRLLWRR